MSRDIAVIITTCLLLLYPEPSLQIAFCNIGCVQRSLIRRGTCHKAKLLCSPDVEMGLMKSNGSTAQSEQPLRITSTAQTGNVNKTTSDCLLSISERKKSVFQHFPEYIDAPKYRGRRFLLLTSLGAGVVTLLLTSTMFNISECNPARQPLIIFFIMIFTAFYSIVSRFHDNVPTRCGVLRLIQNSGIGSGRNTISVFGESKTNKWRMHR